MYRDFFRIGHRRVRGTGKIYNRMSSSEMAIAFQLQQTLVSFPTLTLVVVVLVVMVVAVVAMARSKNSPPLSLSDSANAMAARAHCGQPPANLPPSPAPKISSPLSDTLPFAFLKIHFP